MKNINVLFTDKEYRKLAKAKRASGLTWHNFILEYVAVMKEFKLLKLRYNGVQHKE